MKLEFNPKKILAQIQPFIDGFERYAVIIFAFAVAGIFGFLVWRIGSFANAEPTGPAVDEKLLTVVRPKIDTTAIKQIEELQANNIDIKSVFSADRINPFQE